MTDWIHCNKCYKQPGPPNNDKFNLTNCGHFVCETCASKKPGFCYQCETNCAVVTLSPNLDEEIRCYFTNIDEQYDQLQKLLKNMLFQKNHRQNFFAHLCKENKHLSKEVQNLNYKYTAAKKYIKQIHDENKRLKDQLKNLANTPASNQIQGHCSRPSKNNSFMTTGGSTLSSISKKINKSGGNFANINTPLQSNYFQTPNSSEITFKSLFTENCRKR